MFKIKSKIIRLALSGFLCVSMLFAQASPAFATESEAAPTPTPNPHTAYYTQSASTDSISGWPAGPQIEGESAVLIDLVTGAVLYSKNADKIQYPASITKILTALLGCEYLDMKGGLTVSQSAAYGIEPGSSSIYADTGEQFTIIQALMAVMLESANEMSLAIAEETSGSTKKFVELMNERAAQIGCTNTHFNNPNGLPDELHYTTANDMAKIARAAWYNPRFRFFVCTDYYEIPPTNIQKETRYMLNHHKMMAGRDYAYDGVLGGKTGYTQVAGNTLVTYARRGNMYLAAVVLQSIGGAYSDTKALLDYGFDNFQRVGLHSEVQNATMQLLPSEKYILNDDGNNFPYCFKQVPTVTVPKNTDLKTLTRTSTLREISIGPSILETSYYYNGQLVGTGTQYEKKILSDLLL